MNLKDFEDQLGSHSISFESLASLILETEVENQALMRVVLRNQAKTESNGDPALALAIEKEYYDTVNDLKNEILAKKLSKYST